MPFQYRDTTDPRFANTIGDLILRRGDIAAQQARDVANAQARAVEVGGNAAAGAAQAIGAQVAAIPQQIQKQKQEQQQSQIGALDLQAKQRASDATKALSSVMTDTPKLSEDGVSVWDVPTITRTLADKGFGPEAGAAAQHLDGINNAFRQARAAQKALVMTGAQSVAAAGNDPTLADHFLDQMEANKLMPTDQVAQYRDFIKADPANTAKLTAFLMGPQKGEVVPEGATVINPVTNQPTFKGTPKPPTRVELGVIANDPTKTPEERAAAAKALATAFPQQPKAAPSLEEQYVTAVAKGDTATAATIKQTWEDKAKASRDPNATAQLAAIRNLSQQEAQARLDERDTGSPKNQQKFEQQYRTVLTRAMSSRSGGIGQEDAKVQQANHLMSLFEQTYNPKTGGYDIPRVQLNELALGLAKLTAGTGPAGEGMLKEFQQRTAKGDVAGALTYLTGQPIAANTQALTTFLKDSIERQGKTAEQNREGEMAYLRGQAPTDLEESRRQALEATSLNPLRQSRVIQNTTSGERKLQVSVDGGKTWK